MDEEFTAYLKHLRAHRAELAESMAALDAALATPLGTGVLWRRRVRAALTELDHDLRDHVAITERPGGLHDSLRAAAPRLSSGVDRLTRDHEAFLAEVTRLLDERDEGLDDAGVQAHREAATSLVGQLVRHRQRGADLLYEAYALDLGGSG